MFHRKEDGKLVFERIKFEVMIDNILESVKPKSMDDLKWMIEKMVDSVQIAAQDYAECEDSISEEWEDIFEYWG